VLAGSAALLVGAAVAGVGVALHDRTGDQPVTGALPAAASAPAAGSAAAPPNGVLPSRPAGYTGGMPRTAAQWAALGRAYDEAQQYPQALAAYEMALKLQPGADDVVLLRDDVLVRSGRPADALPTLEQLAARYPDNPDVLLILGLAQNRTGAAAGAATLRRFLQLAPDSPAAPGVRKLLGQQ
jgi:cytochrome c-type biogenesis protein CcmH